MSVFDKKNIPCFIKHSFDKFAEMEHKMSKDKSKNFVAKPIDKKIDKQSIEDKYKENAPKIGNVCSLMD